MHDLDLILTLAGGFTAALILGYLTHRAGLSPHRRRRGGARLFEAILDRLGATPEQINRERDRAHRELFGDDAARAHMKG